MQKIFSILFALLPAVVSGQTHELSMKDENGKLGLINAKGEWIVQPVYEELDIWEYQALDWNTQSLEIGSVWVFTCRNAQGAGILDSTGRVLIPAVYDEVEPDMVLNGDRIVFAVLSGKKWAIFGPDGKPLTEFKYKSVDTGNFEDGIIAYVSRNGKKQKLLDGYGSEVPIK